MTLQEQFEAWAQEAPREWSIEKQSELGAFPGQYRDYHVQAAWEAWEAATYLRTTGDTPWPYGAKVKLRWVGPGNQVIGWGHRDPNNPNQFLSPYSRTPLDPQYWEVIEEKT